MKIKELSGGTTIGVAPELKDIPLKGMKPRLRVGTPGSILSNVGMARQWAKCAKLELGVPEAHLAKVVFRNIDGVVHLVIIPVKEEGPDVYEVKYEGGRSKTPVIRQLKPLFATAQIVLRPDVWYDMASEIVKDQEHGYGVAGVWTDAVITLRSESEKDEVEESAAGGAAAGQQEE